MSAPWLVAAGLLVGVGCFVMLVGAIGLLRFPDFYSRIHPAGKGDTLGQGLVLLGLVLAALGGGEDWGVWVKLLLIVAFISVANPTATHALTRAAWVTGVRPWTAPGDAEAEASLAGQPGARTPERAGGEP